ncbi:hypothetical protein CALCODRAFT_519842 [Calocera cornea HHB12733]|uniref:Uncharacterized protein n=1 Tax=Calocera cornea HHB12733 TaxID=1353952 RepID=A0A165DY43_9BASI|nr:hypothetical protein CALCODRAFT_519842 [Calocera cornea HHB12733]
MRMAIPDAMVGVYSMTFLFQAKFQQWSSVLQKLCRLLCENGMLEILDDGWTYLGKYYNANISTFKMSYEEHFEFMMREKGYKESIRAARHYERLIERPLRNIEYMAPVARGPINVVNLDPKLDWRWRKTLFLAEQAIRNTLLPIVARTEPDPSSPAAKMTSQEKHDLFAQDVDGLVELLKVYVYRWVFRFTSDDP